ncbi:MAG: DUF2799 domain-containing protein [Thiohalomonadales bacterium]
MNISVKNLSKISLNFSVLLLILISNLGCTTIITEAECRSNDFSTLGYNDASQGKYRDHFNAYYEKCQDYNIDIKDELVMYDYGRERGLLNYCDQVRFSDQCDRGTVRGITSTRHINVEMQSLVPSVPRITP